MATFSPGDRVVAINTDMSHPLYNPNNSPLNAFSFPDGPPRKDVVYHVEAVELVGRGDQGLYITGLRVFCGKRPISWFAQRFRKVEDVKVHAPKKRRRKQPAKVGLPAPCTVT